MIFFKLFLILAMILISYNVFNQGDLVSYWLGFISMACLILILSK
jgi:hypothetical protein